MVYILLINHLRIVVMFLAYYTGFEVPSTIATKYIIKMLKDTYKDNNSAETRVQYVGKGRYNGMRNQVQQYEVEKGNNNMQQ